MDDSAQGYKVECNGNEAPCKESSCEGLRFQFTTRNREKLQYPNNIRGGEPPLFGEQQPNLALHGDAFLGCLEGQKEYRKGYWTCAQREGAWTGSPSWRDCPLLLTNPEEHPETPYRRWEDTKGRLGFNASPEEGSGLFLTRLSPPQGCQGLSCHNFQEPTYPTCKDFVFNVLLKTVWLAPVIDIK